MSKRPGSDDYHYEPPHKRPALQAQDAAFSSGGRRPNAHSHNNSHGQSRRNHSAPSHRAQSSTSTLHAESSPPRSQKSALPSILPDPLPPLPELSADLSEAPFIHKSGRQYTQNMHVKDMSYERLEFLGDAYIELFASKIIYTRCHYLPAGQMSQVRELLVKNETLAEYSRGYGFDKRIEVDSMRHMVESMTAKGNKGLNKVFGDVFEAYLAAVVLSDEKEGMSTAEAWVTALWEPRMLAWEQANNRSSFGPPAIRDAKIETDPRTTYNPDAKQELSRRLIWTPKEVRLKYEPLQKMIQLAGDQRGQTRHFVGVFLSGYGHDKYLLGKGEGKSSGEAGQWAAIDAMHGDMKDFVAECAQKCVEFKEKRKQETKAMEEQGQDEAELKQEKSDPKDRKIKDEQL